MRTKIESDGKNLSVIIPAEILDQAGFEPDQCVEITASESTIVLNTIPEEPNDLHCKSLAARVHAEALELFEGDVAAKNRWMTLPQAPLDGRRPSEMLQTEREIEALRLLIGRLEHGSIP
jgi:Protein of unknown function (DUF2384).